MRVLLVDDESLALDELSYLLAPHKHIKIIGQCNDIQSAQQLIEKLSPDCIFLDINMPDGDGFKLLENLEFTPNVIFTTAYQEYALQAFDVGACDYLVKPIDEKRLAAAIDKVENQLTLNTSKVQAENTARDLRVDDKIFVKDNGKCWLVKLENIDVIESIGNYSRLSFNGDSAMIKRSLNHLEERLPKTFFFRANRQVIININSVESIETIEAGCLVAHMNTGVSIELSRRQSNVFREYLSV